MDNKQLIAIKRTSITVVLLCLIPMLLVGVFTFIPIEISLYLIMFGVIGFFVWMIYSIHRNRIDYEEALRNTEETINSYKKNK
jgi:amino acid transporter